ncbi:MAG: exodeoxyribonuclease VII small subunit [Brachymonas sp.]|nr:exodeoxyribonuclease VII small subunit [Brachymonas sp.]
MSTKPKSPAAAKLPATYEAALAELDALVANLESGQVPLDELLAGYQRGATLLEFCKAKLAAVEQQIKVLDGNAAAGPNATAWEEPQE